MNNHQLRKLRSRTLMQNKEIVKQYKDNEVKKGNDEDNNKMMEIDQ